MSSRNEAQPPAAGLAESGATMYASTPISFTPIYFTFLQQAIHEPELLNKSGFILQQLTDDELAARDRCKRCHTRNGGKSGNDPKKTEAKPLSGSGALISEEEMDLLQRLTLLPTFLRYQFHFTPTPTEGNARYRQVVAIDCEMGTAVDNESELIRITLADYFTTEVLIDTLVWPDAAMLHLNTRYSGVSWAVLTKAKKEGRCTMGVASAREAIWEYVSPSTIVVGHSLHCDLTVLRWIHPVVVDSLLLEKAVKKAEQDAAEAEAKKEESGNKDHSASGETAVVLEAVDGNQEAQSGSGKANSGKSDNSGATRSRKGELTLKKLAMERLGRKIQNRAGHDSLEDALAARDIVHWHISKEIRSLEEFWG
ncbi:hypothetical protein SODALDRAFT_351319 [Sodiomyces alkalinus F11]|uniref:Exonuclease domain-containing protein n=1 Tax=Sodiomyces alkalinus (strain CBS 110278 / VKM F-3762 / F11) TaxID=1314773 RepID=A0A3N2PUR5_SODAK|nr:hypothetical protein SODALDRAFT_351319 [Sodiomyces alkalinus F11]ROT38204.1 hypothetical protein SODALDRAFT_351319 [Sodiomyces alkalinus F11]